MYRVSIKSFPDYKHLLQENYLDMLELYVAPQLEEFPAVDNFPTRWCTSTVWFGCSSVFGCNISKQADWERWSDNLATTIAGYHPPLTSFYGGYVKDKLFSKPVPDITNLKERITDAFTIITTASVV